MTTTTMTPGDLARARRDLYDDEGMLSALAPDATARPAYRPGEIIGTLSRPLCDVHWPDTNEVDAPDGRVFTVALSDLMD